MPKPPGFDLLVEGLLDCGAFLGHVLGELLTPSFSLDPTGALGVLRDALREFLAPIGMLHGGPALVAVIAILVVLDLAVREAADRCDRPRRG